MNAGLRVFDSASGRDDQLRWGCSAVRGVMMTRSAQTIDHQRAKRVTVVRVIGGSAERDGDGRIADTLDGQERVQGSRQERTISA